MLRFKAHDLFALKRFFHGKQKFKTVLIKPMEKGLLFTTKRVVRLVSKLCVFYILTFAQHVSSFFSNIFLHQNRQEMDSEMVKT